MAIGAGAGTRPNTHGPMRFGGLVLLGGFGGFMAWAVLAPLAEAVIAPGVIQVEGMRRTVQHLEGGVVRDILVRDGDRVHAGQVLLRLDATQAEASAAALRAQRFALLAQRARIMAESAASPLAFPEALRLSPDPRAAEAMAGQAALFAARQAALEGQIAVLTAREGQARAAIAAAEGQIRAAERQLALINEEEEMRDGLVRQGLSRRPELLALRRAQAGLEGNLEEQRASIERARASLAEAESQRAAMRAQRQQEISTEAREVAARLAQVEEGLRAAEEILARQEIRAPEDGVVVHLRLHTRGGVLRPGEAVLELVPQADRLVAEVQVPPSRIENLRLGLPAQIHLPGRRPDEQPPLPGEVIFIAADATRDEATRSSYFRAQVSLPESLPAGLTPGTPVEAHLNTGQRSFWRYATEPLRQGMNRAFREP